VKATHERTAARSVKRSTGVAMTAQANAESRHVMALLQSLR
jgi:hypothetical protein